MDVCIIKYNAGNCASVANALARLGVTARVSDDPTVIAAAPRVILPGVGHAAAAMTHLRNRGLDRVIRGLRQPFLGICLGLQLLCEASEEGDTACLGIFPHRVRRFAGPLKVPHMGWNDVSLAGTGLGAGTHYYYFLHGYRADTGPCTLATCDYGGTFSAIMRRDNFLAMQFHPEKSSRAGAALLGSFVGS